MVKDREAWHGAVHGVTKSWTSDWTPPSVGSSSLTRYRIQDPCIWSKSPSHWTSREAPIFHLGQLNLYNFTATHFRRNSALTSMFVLGEHLSITPIRTTNAVLMAALRPAGKRPESFQPLPCLPTSSNTSNKHELFPRSFLLSLSYHLFLLSLTPVRLPGILLYFTQLTFSLCSFFCLPLILLKSILCREV